MAADVRETIRTETATLDTADEAEESDPFADIEKDEDELEENEPVLVDCYLYTVNVSLQATPHLQYSCIICIAIES